MKVRGKIFRQAVTVIPTRIAFQELHSARGRGTAPSDLGQEGRTLEGRRRSLGTEIRLEGGLNNNNNNKNNNNNNNNNKLEGELRTEQVWIIQCKGEDRRREIIETATEVSNSILSE